MKTRLPPAALLAYILCVWLAIEAMNAQWGVLLPMHGPEQDGGGHGKMRGAMGEFQNVLLLFGTWVYPACLIAAVALLGQCKKNPNRTQKFVLLSCAAFCLLVLGRFMWLGVFFSGAGF